jgi:hypothetical protein
MENNSELIRRINPALSLSLPEHITLQQLQDELALHINQLIAENFEKLINLLYRLDVSEVRLKKLLLEDKTEEAGQIIAALIIERQMQKIKSRRQFNQRDDNIDEEERW